MSRRRLVHRLMMLAPMMVLGYIGLEARTGTSTYVTPHYSDDLQQRLLAYREPMLYMGELGIRRSQKAQIENVRTAAKFWVAERRAGRLKLLPAEYRGDSIREGVKGQIKIAAQRLVSELFREAEANKFRNHQQSLEDLDLAFQVSAILRRSDLYSIGYFSIREKSMLDLCLELAHEVHGSELAYLNRIISAIELDDVALKSTFTIAKRLDLWAQFNEPENWIDYMVTSADGTSVQAALSPQQLTNDQEWLSGGRYYAEACHVTKKIALDKTRKVLAQRMKETTESR